MRFSIHTGNHQDSPTIGDMVQFVRCALADCGHDAQINGHIVDDRINVVLEHFVDAESVARLVEGHARGARVVLIGTEPIVGGTFNGHMVDSHWHYSNAPYWRERYESFLKVSKLADAVWVFAESMVEGYRAVFPDKPVVFLPHGHVEGFQSVRHRPAGEKDIDFYFSGAMTSYRQAILQRLAKRHRVAYNNQSTPEYLRVEQLSRSKVCLSLRLMPENVIPSVSRMHFHLQNCNFMIHERYERPCARDPFVLHVPPEELIDWAVAALAMTNRSEVAQAAHTRFRHEMPMGRLMQSVLEDSRLAAPSGTRMTSVAHARGGLSNNGPTAALLTGTSA
jgi:hypothetical protein